MEVYLVNSFDNGRGTIGQAGSGPELAMGKSRTGNPNRDEMEDTRTLAHELGHVCGLAHAFSQTDRGNLGTALVRRDWLPLDWNGGTGQAYYERDLLQGSLVDKLLMSYGNGYDIPLGPVWALDTAAKHPVPSGSVFPQGQT